MEGYRDEGWQIETENGFIEGWGGLTMEADDGYIDGWPGGICPI